MAVEARGVVYKFGVFVLDAGNAELRRGSRRIPLRAKSFAFLLLLVDNAKRLLTRETIMEALWPDTFVVDDNITQCVHDVRSALGRGPRHLLRTIPRWGYIFEAEVVRQQPAPEALDVDFASIQADRTALAHGETLSIRDQAARASGLSHNHITGAERPVRISILVLPLQSPDGSDTSQHVADCVTEDIVTDLAKHLGNLCLGEAQVLLHDNQLARWRTSSRDGQVNYVLRGNVQSTPRISVSLQLIETLCGVCIWAERYELHNHRDLVARWVNAISSVLARDVARRIESRPTSYLTLHDLLALGRAWLLRPASPCNRRQALCWFERAIAREPDSIGSRLGIAAVLVGNLADGWSHAIKRDGTRAEALLMEACQTGKAISITHAINGTLRRLQGRLAASLAELELAVDLSPHYTLAASQLGMTLLFLGRPEAAFPYLERAVRMGPHDPQAPYLLCNLGMGHLLLGNVDTAIDEFRRAEAGNPQFFGSPLLLAAALGFKSARVEAAASLQRCAKLCPELGTLSGLRDWVKRQAGPHFMPIYEHMIERGLRCAGMAEDLLSPAAN